MTSIWDSAWAQWLVRAGAAACLAVATWRLLLSASEHDDGFGLAQREHRGLLALQGLCALVAAGAMLGARDSAMSDEPRMANVYRAILAIAICGFFLVFTKHDLLAFGGFEN